MIFLRHELWKLERLLVYRSVTLQHSALYNRRERTHFKFVFFANCCGFPDVSIKSLINAHLVFPTLELMYLPHSDVTVLPRYVKDEEHSSFPFTLISGGTLQLKWPSPQFS